jgi:hypothetical protein
LVVVAFAAGVLVVMVLVLVLASAGLATMPSAAIEAIRAFIGLPSKGRSTCAGIAG